uniref:aspartyl/asparaginyl beta-hydroxylase-like isoform X1 n=1 Tax=Styela clava TaxID=7725 RepID=UPI00193ACF18|nr:aspartyl/asparaginyl beta-hydroxylase-like isoform X1 [Styela clava]
MSSIHPGNLHGTGDRTNKSRYHYARQRVQEAQKSKMEESDGARREETARKQTNNGLIVILILMIVLTWGIAATAYFGVIDYKGLVVRGSRIKITDAAGYASALYPFQYDSARHPLKAIGKFLTSIDDYITNFLFSSEVSTNSLKKHRPIVRTIPLNKESNIVKRDTSKSESVVSDDSNPTKKPAEEKDVAKASDPSNDKDKPRKAKSPQPKQPKDSNTKKTKQETVKTNESTKKKKPSTVSEEDKKILNKLKEGERLLEKKKGTEAWKYFKKLSADYPESPKARFYRGKSEAMVAEQQKSNPMLTQAITTFTEVSEMSNCPKELQKQALIAKGERESFLGRMKPALQTQIELAKLYPKDIGILNKLGVRYLMLGKNTAAKKVYAKVLRLSPNDGFALVHMGFILKNAGEWAESVPYLMRGTESNEQGTQEGKFYFHLGDALYRTNQTKEAEQVYEKAAAKGLFRSKYQRSLYNVDRLRGKPFWTPEEAGVKDYVRRLELNWKLIRDEAMAILNTDTGLFDGESESLRDTGEWKQFPLFQRGRKEEANCRRTPKTCNILERMPNAAGCRRGQVKFSVMMPGTHVWPHTGPTNCRLRMHLGLVIPTTGSGTRLTCAGEMRTWQEGKVWIFDDSFEHEVWQQADSLRLILIVDIWHPDITEHEKKTLTAI